MGTWSPGSIDDALRPVADEGFRQIADLVAGTVATQQALFERLQTAGLATPSSEPDVGALIARGLDTLEEVASEVSRRLVIDRALREWEVGSDAAKAGCRR